MKPLMLLCIGAVFWIACRQESSVESEEEAAYMADYEAPADAWGFMDTTGELAIKAVFDDVGLFSGGLAAVNKGGKWGYIDRTGKIIIEPVYRSAWAYHEGFARVLPFDGPDRFINPSGEAIPADNWAAADDFSEGRARVKVGSLFGYIDVAGKLVIQPIYSRGWNFESDLAVIEYHDKLGVINTKGENILDPEYDQIKKGPQFILARKGETAIAFDLTGKELISIPNAKMIDTDGRTIAVRSGDRMYMHDMQTGQKNGADYSNIIYLDQSLWAAKIDSGYILIDSEGNRINRSYYTQLNKFKEGFAAYSKDDLWGYVNLQGEEVTGEVFGLAWDYREGFARAAFKDGIAFIDRSQKLAFYPPPGALDMRDFSEGLASVMLD